MSNSVYFIHHYHAIGNYKWAKELSEIKELNPNIVVCFCLEEWDVEYIFRNLFPSLSDWAVKNKKMVRVLTSVADNRTVLPRIVIEKTFGLYDLAKDLSKTIVETNQVVNPFHCSKVYTNYNNNNKYERAVLLEELARRHLLQHGMVTFLNPEKIQDSFKGDRFEGWKYHNGSKLIDENEFPPETWSLPKTYLAGLIDIVSETSVRPNDHYVTEKTIKPIVTLKPFICLSSPNYHRFLAEEFGLELYDELFDYSFDQEYDLHKRINMIVDELERIVQMYNDEFKMSMYEKLLPKLIRNREKYMDYGNQKEKMVIRTIKHIATQNYSIYGQEAGIGQYEDLIEWYKKENWL